MDPLVLTLRALQSAADRKGIEAPMTWDALNQTGQQYGSPDIDYDRFAARWESDPILKKLVDRFDGHGLVIKTQKNAEHPEQGNPEQKQAADAVDAMAKSATKKAMKA